MTLPAIRGVIFALAFHPLRAILFEQRRGWLILWWLLLSLGVLSTFEPAFGSVEGLIYTTLSPRSQIFGLWASAAGEIIDAPPPAST